MMKLVSADQPVYILSVSTISVSNLKKRSAKQWANSAKIRDLVITAQGRPVAVLLPVDAESLDLTLSTLRSVRAIQAQAALQRTAAANGTDRLTIAEIDTEIATARRSRRRK